MEVQTIDIHGHPARLLVFGGVGPHAHFLHANGYPPGVYTPLLEDLTKTFGIDAMQCRAMWPDIGKPGRSLRWPAYGADLIALLERTTSKPVIGMGHSMGATATVSAAAKRPDLFSQLVLIEPAAVPTSMALLAQLVPYAIRRRFLQPGKATLRRRDHWPSRAQYLDQCRRSKPLRGLDEDALAMVAQYGVVETDDGVTLAFPKTWEAHNFFCPASLWSDLKAVRCPITVLRGEASIYFSEAMWSQWRRLRPTDTIHKLAGHGHLMPLEAPGQCADAIRAAVSL